MTAVHIDPSNLPILYTRMQMILYLCINMTALLMVANTQGELKGKCDKTTFVIVSFLCNPRDLAMLLLILITAMGSRDTNSK